MGDYLMSTIKANDIQNASGGIPTVKGQKLIPTAWVNFNGTSTVAIRASENVSSITDNGTGDYSANFAVAMANINYSVSTSGSSHISTHSGYTAYLYGSTNINPLSTGSVRVQCIRHDATFRDLPIVTITILGGQA